MSDIDFETGAVCYGDGRQWFVNTGSESEKFELANNDGSRKYSFYGILNFPKDFQPNEITTGDFIPASELDTEQKYNEVVEVFGLFGFKFGSCATKEKPSEESGFYLSIVDNEIWNASGSALKRQLTYHQIIAIGKLKRMMLESAVPAVEFGVVEDEGLTADRHKSAVDYLTECVEVQKQRGEQYDSTGTGERSFDAAAKAYNALTGGNIKGSDVCLILTCVKAVRQYSNPERLHEDSLLDLVSYASLWAEELNKELK